MAGPVTTIHLTMKFKPDNLATWTEQLKLNLAELKNVDELQYYNLFTLPHQPGTIRMVEIWNADLDWLQNVRLLCLLLCSR